MENENFTIQFAEGFKPVTSIGSNGNWFIDGADTGCSSIGAEGPEPVITIVNNNWYVDGVDTGIAATANLADMKSTLADMNDTLDTMDSTLEDMSTSMQTFESNTSTQVNDMQEVVNTCNTRMEALIPSGTQTEGNTELIDIRAGANGVAYASAGDAVRGQYSELNETISYNGLSVVCDLPITFGYHETPCNIKNGEDVTIWIDDIEIGAVSDYLQVTFLGVHTFTYENGKWDRTQIVFDAEKDYTLFTANATCHNFDDYNKFSYTGHIATSTISEKLEKQFKTVIVDKNGTGDYTSLTKAIAERSNGNTIKVLPGIYDLYDEGIAYFGSDYFTSQISDTNRGLHLKNGTTYQFMPNAIVKFDHADINDTVKNWFSPFNAGVGGFTLDGCTIISKNCRYSVHDEMGGSNAPYTNKYSNCLFIHDVSEITNGYYQCIGGGLGKNGYIVIENSIFESACTNEAIVSYHNNIQANSKSRISISGCYVKGTNTLGFGWYGQSSDITEVLVSNNSLGSDISFKAEAGTDVCPYENMELLTFNNEVRN